MFTRLQQKWKVGGWQLCCILLVFAITGTLTAWISRTITAWLGMTDETFWAWKLLVRLAVLVFGYQVILLTTAFYWDSFLFSGSSKKKYCGKYSTGNAGNKTCWPAGS